MRALVTGASGFVGHRLVECLLESGWEVCCLLRRPRQPRRHGLAVVQGDLLQDSSLTLDAASTGEIDAVFHCAALLPDPAIQDSSLFIQANTTATLKLLEACDKRGIARFVYLSSISVIGEPKQVPITEDHALDPQSAYALSKLGGEYACSLARHRGIKATAFRLSSPYGHRMNPATVLPLFVRLAREGKPIRWHGSGSRSQDFIHVDDVAAACMLAATAPISGTYCLGSGRATSMRRLAEVVTSLIPGSMAEASGQPDPQEGRSWQLDITALRRDIGFAPQVSIEQGLENYIQVPLSADSGLWS
jgi:UDP-glucose 4-epimerase